MQCLDGVAGVLEEPLVHALFTACQLVPPLGRVIQQRGHFSALGQGDCPGYDRWWCGDRGLVVAALDRVLQLEGELRRHASKVDPGLAAAQAVSDVPVSYTHLRAHE